MPYTGNSYIDREQQYNQDAIVNGLGNGTLEIGSDKWYELHSKAYGLEQQKIALQMGKMGQLNGERAVTAEEQAAAGTTRSGGGYRGNVSFSANNGQAMYVGTDDDENSQTPEEQVEVVHSLIDDEQGDFQTLGDIGSKVFVQTMRLYEINGTYVCDLNNALTKVIDGI